MYNSHGEAISMLASLYFAKLAFSSFSHLNFILGVLNPRLSSPGSCPSWEHHVVFLCKTLYSHSASLRLHVHGHVGVQMGAGEFNTKRKPCKGLAPHPRNTPSHFMLRKGNYCRPDGPLVSYAHFTFNLPATIKHGTLPTVISQSSFLSLSLNSPFHNDE